jgi:hypothetical protein
MALIIFHCEDASGHPLGGVLAESEGGPGPWQATSNACGDIITELAPAADYVITFTKAGYAERTIPADLAECGIVTVGLEHATAPPVGPGTQPPVVPGTLPPIPTRAQVCALQTSLAGLTYPTVEYGDVPAWFYGTLQPEDRRRARDVHRAAGDTHIPIPVTEAYREPGTLWPPELREGYDYTQDLDTYRAIAREAIEDGFFIDCALGGDGLGSGPDYNDPVGKTYGCGWLMKNVERMIRALQGDGTDATPDLTPYMIFRPGWDSVFYGWGGAEPKSAVYTTPLRWRFAQTPMPAQRSTKELDDQQMRVQAFGEKFRSILPNGYLAIEHTPGNIPCGEGGGDYAPGGLMQTYDTILSEFNSVHEDSCWQIVGRMVSPYHRPPDQPAGDDPHPPWYLQTGSPRGPYFYVAFEPTIGGVYEWCRGRCTLEAVQATRQYLRDLGCAYTG